MPNVNIKWTDPIFKRMYLFKQFEIDHEEDCFWNLLFNLLRI